MDKWDVAGSNVASFSSSSRCRNPGVDSQCQGESPDQTKNNMNQQRTFVTVAIFLRQTENQEQDLRSGNVVDAALKEGNLQT